MLIYLTRTQANHFFEALWIAEDNVPWESIEEIKELVDEGWDISGTYEFASGDLTSLPTERLLELH